VSNFWRGLLRWIGWAEEQLGGLLLLAAVILVFAQIIIRAFGGSLSGLYELATFLVVWSIFLTAGIGIQRNVHVRVDIFLLVCPPRQAYILQIISNISVSFMAGMLCYSGYMLVKESLLFGDHTIGTISIPMWVPQLIMPIGGSLMLIHSMSCLIEIIRQGPRKVTIDYEQEASAM
jgi:TRAP-type C4-dicarboxylate transport system permease small subunit